MQVSSALARLEVTLPTGVRLRYVQQGNRSATPVIFLHGYSDSSFSFSLVMERMHGDIHAIALDQRGHGDSSKPEGGYGVDDFAADVVQFMDALGIPQAMVVGHSMGSLVARRVAILHPGRVTRLVLVGSGVRLPEETAAALSAEVSILTDPVDPRFIRLFQLSTIHRPVPPEFLEQVVRESQKLPARVWKSVLAGMLEPSWMDGLERISCPTLLIGGEQDAPFPAAVQRELARRISGARIHLWPDIGHTPHWEGPDEFVRVAFS
jgi:pimeloyl-ACP methyl ester carboxylesterase